VADFSRRFCLGNPFGGNIFETVMPNSFLNSLQSWFSDINAFLQAF
jgi:hypothetical protein